VNFKISVQPRKGRDLGKAKSKKIPQIIIPSPISAHIILPLLDIPNQAAMSFKLKLRRDSEYLKNSLKYNYIYA
jgi:hypothetical protein